MQKLKTIALLLGIITTIIILLNFIATLYSESVILQIVGKALIFPILLFSFVPLIWLVFLKVSGNKECRYAKIQLAVIYLLILPLFIFGVSMSVDNLNLLKQTFLITKSDKMYYSLSERKAPIKNGIAQFEHQYIQYTVPCKNNKIHGTVIIAHNDSTFKQEIYFNQGQIDSTLYYYENDETLHIYPLNDSSALAVRHYLDYGLMKKDTTIEFADLLWSEYWFYED